MAEYKNGVNAFGNMSVGKEDRSAEVKTGRAVFVDEDKYANDADYKFKVDKCLAEGFHRVGESGGGSSDFSTAMVTITNDALDNGEIFGVYIDPIHDGLTENIIIGNGSTENFQAVLYKGLMIGALDAPAPGEITVSGDITYDNGDIFITGDCTITIGSGATGGGAIG